MPESTKEAPTWVLFTIIALTVTGVGGVAGSIFWLISSYVKFEALTEWQKAEVQSSPVLFPMFPLVFFLILMFEPITRYVLWKKQESEAKETLERRKIIGKTTLPLMGIITFGLHIAYILVWSKTSLPVATLMAFGAVLLWFLIFDLFLSIFVWPAVIEVYSRKPSYNEVSSGDSASDEDPLSPQVPSKHSDSRKFLSQKYHQAPKHEPPKLKHIAKREYKVTAIQSQPRTPSIVRPGDLDADSSC